MSKGIHFPKVYVSNSVGAPAQMANDRKNVIYVGTGSGVAPFLSFIEDHQIVASNLSKHNMEILTKTTTSNFNHAHICLICRDPEQMSWISEYLDAIIGFEALADKVTFHLYLTVRKEINNLPSFLFWRAFILF